MLSKARLAILGLLISACSGTALVTTTASEVQPTTSAAATTTTTTTTTTVAITTTTWTRGACEAYNFQVLGIASRTTDQLGTVATFLSEAIEGLISTDELADLLLIASDTFRKIGVDLTALGPPPPILEQTVRLLQRDVERLAEAYELASRGARTRDVSMLDDGFAMIGDNASIEAATDALQPCS